MRSDDSEETRVDYVRALKEERAMRLSRGEPIDGVEAELAIWDREHVAKAPRATKATRLKGEGRTG